jgi:gamma-glutamyltranspeptidase/glutathione hydrolase
MLPRAEVDMVRSCDRREVLALAGGTLLGGVLGVGPLRAARAPESSGVVVGHPQGAKVGNEILADGGNAVDAAVSAALVAAVIDLQQCGVGGYGGHMTLAVNGGRKVTSIDFNTTAPKAAREDMFPLDAQGKVKGGVNEHGWLATGVPGTMAGLHLALEKYGTRPFAAVVKPALRYARDGFEISAGLATTIRNARTHLAADPEGARLLLDKAGEPLKAGTLLRNPGLADLLQSLAEAGSVEPFYRGPIARRIAEAFKANGGLVTVADLEAYRAREVEPLELSWRGRTIRTAPLTAGGATVLEALGVIQALDEDAAGQGVRPARARLEALRLAWADRLTLLGDPEKAEVPLERLLSAANGRKLAERVRTALKEGKPVAAAGDGRSASGTVNISAADGKGNFVALTLTHGNSFGARVAVPGTGMFLGHGMSRFEPRPGHPNSPGPGKRPLHNMCPTIVLHDGRAVAAVGSVGGRKIPNAVFEVLYRYVGAGASMEEAIAAPRLHTEGGLELTVEAALSADQQEHLRQVGYDVRKGAAAVVHAVALDPRTGMVRAASR